MYSSLRYIARARFQAQYSTKFQGQNMGRKGLMAFREPTDAPCTIFRWNLPSEHYLFTFGPYFTIWETLDYTLQRFEKQKIPLHFDKNVEQVFQNIPNVHVGRVTYGMTTLEAETACLMMMRGSLYKPDCTSSPPWST